MEVEDGIKAGGEALDNLATSQEEYNDQITERQKNDMQSDNLLSKSIRPITLLWLLSLFTWSFMYTQITGKEPNLSYTNLLTSLLTTAIMFYFGSRAAEKISTIIAKRNSKISVIKTRKENRKGILDRFRKK